MGEVVDMTGRVLDAGETVTEWRSEQEAKAALRAAFDDAPDLARYVAEQHDLRYCDAVNVIVHSLLQEAVQASEEHELAREVLESVGSRFFGANSDSSESS